MKKVLEVEKILEIKWARGICLYISPLVKKANLNFSFLFT